MYRPSSTWTWAFLAIVTGQAIIGLALEGYVFGRFIQALNGGAHTPAVRAIDTYLSLFIFGFLYQIGLTWDALRLKNTIQILGLCAYNIGLIIYAAVQTDQINQAIALLVGGDQNVDGSLNSDVRPFLIAVPCVIGLGTILMCFAALKLYQEFAWTIYKHISADLGMRRRYLVYQIYITFLKFDFFFFLSFTVQFLVVVVNIKDVEFGLTVAALPVTIILLILAGLWTRREIVLGMIFTILCYFGGLAYFFFKLIRMYDVSSPAGYMRVQTYLPARRGLTTFAVITILLLFATIIIAIICTFNFGKGLKSHLTRRSVVLPSGVAYGRKQDEGEAFNHSGVPLRQVQARMTID